MKDQEEDQQEQPKKNVVPKNKHGKQDKKVKKVDPKHQEEQEKLFSEANQISPASKKIDEDEIHFIGGTVTTWKELREAHLKFKNFISDKIRGWESTFPEEIYRHGED